MWSCIQLPLLLVKARMKRKRNKSSPYESFFRHDFGLHSGIRGIFRHSACSLFVLGNRLRPFERIQFQHTRCRGGICMLWGMIWHHLMLWEEFLQRRVPSKAAPARDGMKKSTGRDFCLRSIIHHTELLLTPFIFIKCIFVWFFRRLSPSCWVQGRSETWHLRVGGQKGFKLS